jgi:hypothetical protein
MGNNQEFAEEFGVWREGCMKVMRSNSEVDLSGLYIGAGVLIRCRHIYNFLCSMLVLHQLLYVLLTLCGIFMHFLELTY